MFQDPQDDSFFGVISRTFCTVYFFRNWFTKGYRLKFTKGYKLDSIREILSLPLFLPLESRLPSSVRVRGRVRVRVRVE